MKTLPDLVPDAKLKLPKELERTLPSGLTVIAIRRPAVPLVELRLRVPFGRASLPRATLLSQALFTGTGTMSSVQIAAGLQAVGGGLSAGLDPDRLLVTGNALAGGLDRMLEILASVLTDPAYPNEEVATERERLVDHIQVAQSQPAHLARTALLKRMYGHHPYAVQTPEPEQVRGVRPGQLRSLHADRMRPDGSVLVLVGDINPEKAIDAAEKALGSWTGPGKDGDVPPTPELESGPLLLVDRPGSVQ
ncbi:MAG TPA: insulinase family protein, partial [Actinoplanes sp.]